MLTASAIRFGIAPTSENIAVLIGSQQQDHVGNIYIECPGLDKEQSAIALAFDLESPAGSESLLSGALNIFLDLEHSKTSCPIALLGWPPPGGFAIGRKCCEGLSSKASAYE